MLIANALKGNLNSRQTPNALWIVNTIKAILMIPIHKFEKPIFSFRRTHEAAIRNNKVKKREETGKLQGTGNPGDSGRGRKTGGAGS